MPSSPTPLFTSDERTFLQAVVRVGYANPFAPARVEAVRAALGAQFVDFGDALSPRGGPPLPDPNLRAIAAKLGPILDAARERIGAGAAAEREDLVLYKEACLYALRDRHDERLRPIARGGAVAAAAGATAGLYRPFLDDYRRLLGIEGVASMAPGPEHVFACADHLGRAYRTIFTSLIGTSRPMAELRAAVWNAIFTRDLAGYLRVCGRRRSDVSTLVTGPSGTGKELVARAVGTTRFRPYDAEQARFVVPEGTEYCPVDPSALPDALFEAELFGHERGAFTGAVKERKGIFETVRDGGAVFFDEIGELALDRQVKLLRVLQEGVFHRVGDPSEHSFSARIICATHRDMSERVRTGAFRLDLYQRLAGLRIVTPSLREQLDAAPGDLPVLVLFFARRVTEWDEEAAEKLAADAVRYIEARLSRYAWSGNARELGHCIESIHHGGEFVPLDLGGDEDPARSLREGTLSEPEAIRRYRNIVVARTGSVSAAAKLLGVHRNTVSRSLDRARLSRWRLRRPR